MNYFQEIAVNDLHLHTMRRYLLISIIALMAFTGTARAQDRAFELKNSLLNIGVGFGWTYKFYNDPSVWPSFSISYEKGLFYMKKIGYFGIGGQAAYHYAHYDYPSSSHYIYWHNIVGTMRFTYHPVFLMTQNFDMYVGFMGGVRYEIFKDTEWDGQILHSGPNPYKRFGGFNALFAGVLGMRFYTGERLGFFAEGGYGLSYVTIGMTWKFGARNLKADPEIGKRGISRPKF